MATDKKGFLLYTDIKIVLDDLPDDVAGKLFKYIVDYCSDLDPQTDDLLLRTAFNPIKAQLKRDLEKYERKRLQQSEAGKRSAELRKQRTSTDVKDRSTNPTVNDNVNVSDSVNVKKDIYKRDSDEQILEWLNSEEYVMNFCKKLRINNEIHRGKESIRKSTELFLNHLHATDDLNKGRDSEYRKHFGNWYNHKLKNV